MQIALFQPDIAGNVGTILRTAACFGVPAHIIEPCGFPFSDQALRRAGMDYAVRANVRRHADWAAFGDWNRADGGRLVLMTTAGAVSYTHLDVSKRQALSQGGNMPSLASAGWRGC